MLQLHEVVQLRFLVEREPALLLALDQLRYSTLSVARGTELRDRFRGSAGGKAVEGNRTGLI